MIGDATELPDWRSDWLYALVLREAEQEWAFCRRKPDGKHWRYVLIEEWSGASPHGHATGKLLRAWVRDESGLRAIGLDEHKQHKRKIHGRIYPFAIMSFHIEPHRRRVVLGHRHASTAGYGCTYFVRGEGANAAFEVDPQRGQWRS